LSDRVAPESKLLRKVLQPAAERAGLGRVTWHQFRHTHSSLLTGLRVLLEWSGGDHLRRTKPIARCDDVRIAER